MAQRLVFIETDWVSRQVIPYLTIEGSYLQIAKSFSKDEREIDDLLEAYIIGRYRTHSSLRKLIEGLPENLGEDIEENMQIIKDWCKKCKDKTLAEKFVKLFDTLWDGSRERSLQILYF